MKGRGWRNTFDQIEVRSEVALRRFELEAPGGHKSPPGAGYGYLPVIPFHEALQKVRGFV
jgi:hypothetical protein